MSGIPYQLNSKNIILYVFYSILIAVIYLVFALITKPLLLPPTFAAPIWAPAGIGVGVLVLWGYRYIPAIILGETLVNLSFYGLEFFIKHPMLMLTYSMLILVVVFRSSFATYLLNNYLGKSNNFLTLQSVSKLLILGSIVPSFISSIFATTLLYSNNIFYFDTWAVNFLTWWYGDAVGICVILPLMFLIFKKPRKIWRPRMYKTVIPVFITFVLLIIATSNIKNLELSRLVNILDNKVELLHKGVVDKYKTSLNKEYLNLGANEAISTIYENDLKNIIRDLGLQDIHFSIYSNTEVLNEESPKIKLFESNNTFSMYQQWKTTKEVFYFDHKWQINAYATSASYFQNSSWLIWWITSIGFLFIAILAAGLLVITGSHRIIQDTVDIRTKEIKTLYGILKQSESRYKQLIEIQPVVFWRHVRGEKSLDFVSKEAINILGYTKKELLDIDHIWNKIIHPDDCANTLQQYHLGLESKQRFSLKYRAKAKNGEYIWFKDYISTRKTEDKTEVIGLKIDITKDQLKKQEIIQLAYYDAMTGLPNRVNFMEHLSKAILKSGKNKTFGAILFLDLDRFKVLNDSMGHSFGDKLLIQICQRFHSILDGRDIASRFGGDEFVILIGEQCKSLDLIKKKSIEAANAVQSMIKEPFDIDGHSFFTSFSIGISIFPHDSSDGHEIIQQADIAMYASKEKGQNTISYFQNEMQQLANNKLIIEKSFKYALINKEFEMYYQPIFNDKKEIIKYEALIRWNHPSEGILTPNSFIHIAEETGFIIELSERIFDNVIKQIAQWKKSNFKNIEVSINISLFQFINTRIVETLEKTIRKYNVDSRLITLELTESVGIQNFDEMLLKLNQLSDLGFKIAIDDFGTGYSSLDYLIQMPVDILKLDKSFVANIGKEMNSHSLIGTIILMAKQLDLELIVEGVETIEQFNFLKELGCNKFQGYLVSRALPVKKLEKLLNSTIA